MNGLHFSGQIIQHVIGFEINKQLEFQDLDKDKFDLKDEEFFDIYFELQEGKISIEDFKKRGLEIMENGLKTAKQKRACNN